MNTEDEDGRRVLMALLMGPSPFSRQDIATLLLGTARSSTWFVAEGYVNAAGTMDYYVKCCTVSQKGKDSIIKGETK